MWREQPAWRWPSARGRRGPGLLCHGAPPACPPRSPSREGGPERRHRKAMARRGREPIGRLRGALDSPGRVWGATRGRPRAGGAGRIIGFRPFLVKTRESPRLQQPVWTLGAPCLADLPPGAGGAGRRGPRRRCAPVTGPRRSLRPLQRAPGAPRECGPQASGARRTASRPHGPGPAGSLRAAQLTRRDRLAVPSAGLPGQEH